MAVKSIDQERVLHSGYNHARYRARRNFLRFLIKWLGVPLLVKIDRIEGLDNIPSKGPVVLMINHIAFIDPIIVLHFVPRNIVPLAKVEVYDYPVIGIFPKIWGVIPVQREEFDRRAIREVLEVLNAGEIVLVAPEGTRGPQLKPGKEGVAYLASRSSVPIVPVAVQGTEGFPALRFTSRWKKKGVHLRFGTPFRYRNEYKRAGRDQLRKMTDEAMYNLARMLPAERRGVYSNLSLASEDTIEAA